MKSWSIAEKLSNPLDPDWEVLAQHSLPIDAHQSRKKGFLLSRQALKNALAQVGKKISTLDLILNGYSDLQNVPDVTASISHTSGAGAAAVADRKSLLSLGIDIELTNRVVKNSIFERISNPGDISLEPIKIWTAKEAAFKAIMNGQRLNSLIEFSSIQILDNTWHHKDSGLEGEWELSVLTSYVVARAYLEN